MTPAIAADDGIRTHFTGLEGQLYTGAPAIYYSLCCKRSSAQNKLRFYIGGPDENRTRYLRADNALLAIELQSHIGSGAR